MVRFSTICRADPQHHNKRRETSKVNCEMRIVGATGSVAQFLEAGDNLTIEMHIF
jgi:hypothetical protein